eukprot:SAG31_NODE_2_length_46263_cov_45.908043_32_plen_354_part_00
MLKALAQHLSAGGGGGGGGAARLQVTTTTCTRLSDSASPQLSLADDALRCERRRPALALSERELQEYNQQGLVVPRCRMDGAAVLRLQSLVESTLDITCACEPPVQMPVGPHLPTNLYAAHGMPIPDRLARGWMGLARHPDILGMVQSVLGPDVILWGAQLFNKRAGDGLEVPWHQDGRYWPIHPPATCSVWVGIDDADEENGAMGWIPRSHATRRLFQHSTDNSDSLALNQVLDLRRASLREDEAKLNELEAGQFSLHDVFLVHNSNANRSARRRAGFVMRYMPCSSVFDPERLPNGIRNSSAANFRRPICLCSGQPLANEAYPGLLDARLGAPTKEAVEIACVAVRSVTSQ